MSNPNDSSAHKPQDLIDDLHQLVAEAEKMMGDSISEHSQEALGILRARLHSAQERLVEMGEYARKRVIAGAKSTDECIRANPYQSLAVAAGAGLILGILLSRRCR